MSYLEPVSDSVGGRSPSESDLSDDVGERIGTFVTGSARALLFRGRGVLSSINTAKGRFGLALG